MVWINSIVVRKKGWAIALGLLLIGGIVAWLWYDRVRRTAQAETGANDNTLQPRLELSRFDISDIDAESVKINAYILIDNPLPVAFRANSLRYAVLIDSTTVVESRYAKPISLQASDSTTLTLPVTVPLNKLMAVLKRLEKRGQDSTEYAVRATVNLDVPLLGQKTLTLKHSRRMPTVYLPELKVNDIDLGKLSLKQTDLAANVSIRNPNVFPMNITNTRYTISINNELIADGSQPEPILIKKKAITPVVFPVTLKPGKLLGLTTKVLFDKKHTPMNITFRCTIIDKRANPSFKNSKLALNITGTMDEFLKKANE